jgi:outer membrane protein OmpA-like peptidoglycan-associated protein
MKQTMVVVMLCGVVAGLATGCATKKFVREQLGATETKLGQRVDTQQTELQQTADRTAANSQAIEAAGQRLTGVDSRLEEVSGVATDARKQAGTVADNLRDVDTRLNQRFANRNKYSTLETKSVYFDFNKASLRDEGMSELEDVAKALKADPNTVVELQGYADPRGSDEYNYRLTRDRVDTVVRYLVQQGVELHRVHAAGMGKERQPAGTGREALAKSRRVDIVLIAPQS